MKDKLRSINTKIWSDSWFETLQPTYKLLFLYILTSSPTNMIGVYEITLRKIEYDTGITKATIIKILESFKKDRKVIYVDGFIHIVNFLKNQRFNTLMRKSAVVQYNALPNYIKEKHLQTLDTGTRAEKSFQKLVGGFNIIEKSKSEPLLEIIPPEISTISQVEQETQIVTPGIIVKNTIDYDAFIKYWNKNKGDAVPKIRELTKDRIKLLDKILEKYSRNDIKLAVLNMKNSLFLQGKKPNEKHPNFKAHINFFLTYDKFVGILEGAYGDDKDNAKTIIMGETVTVKSNVQPLPIENKYKPEGKL